MNEAIAALREKGRPHPIKLAKRDRAWDARDLLDLIDDAGDEGAR